MSAQASLDMAVPPPTTNVRMWRGVLRWDTKEFALQYVERRGNLYSTGMRTVQVRPRQTRIGFVLCAWEGGHPYLLTDNGALRRVKASEL